MATTQQFDSEIIKRGMERIDYEKKLVEEITTFLVHSCISEEAYRRLQDGDDSKPNCPKAHDIITVEDEGGTLRVYGSITNYIFEGGIAFRPGIEHFYCGWFANGGANIKKFWVHAGDLNADDLVICIRLLNKLGQELMEKDSSLAKQVARFDRAAARA